MNNLTSMLEQLKLKSKVEEATQLEREGKEGILTFSSGFLSDKDLGTLSKTSKLMNARLKDVTIRRKLVKFEQFIKRKENHEIRMVIIRHLKDFFERVIGYGVKEIVLDWVVPEDLMSRLGLRSMKSEEQRARITQFIVGVFELFYPLYSENRKHVDKISEFDAFDSYNLLKRITEIYSRLDNEEDRKLLLKLDGQVGENRFNVSWSWIEGWKMFKDHVRKFYMWYYDEGAIEYQHPSTLEKTNLCTKCWLEKEA